MWHEARKQEKKIRCMLVDYQRRAQRRKDYYDKIKADPTQFLQLHGRPCKIHLDPAVCIAANSSTNMMPWQGNNDIMIDRFDVRAHLDFISEVSSSNKIHEDLSYEERQINYERYRILVQNDFFNITEEKFLHQINIEEKFGPLLKNTDQETNVKRRPTVAIGYNYEDDSSQSLSSVSKHDENSKKDNLSNTFLNLDENNEEDSESDIDLDLTVDVSKIEMQQANELNTCAHSYGMLTNDFFSFLNNDLEEAENLRIVKEQEEEKAMFSGRKSRKERRAFRERTLIGRKLSPPSYAWRKSPSYEDYKALVTSNRSRSKSSSPMNSGKITYITSFGGDEPSSSTSVSKTFSNSVCSKDVRRKSRRSRSMERYNKSRHSRKSPVSRSSRSRSKSKSSFARRSKSRKRDESVHIDKKYEKSTLRNVTDNVLPLASTSGIFNHALNQDVVPKYYGRHKFESSSELSLSSDDESNKVTNQLSIKKTQVLGSNRVNVPIKVSGMDNKLTPQERLKRKRQVLLNKQFKADKKAEREKVLKMVQERIDRAEEMKEISIKLRRRHRMLRHNDSPRRHSSPSSRSRSRSAGWRSFSRSPSNKRFRRYEGRCKNEQSPSDNNSGENYGNDKKKSRKKYERSRSRSRSRSHCRSVRRKRLSQSRGSSSSCSEEKCRKNIEASSRYTKENEKNYRSKRYCSLSEEGGMTRIHLEKGTESNYKYNVSNCSRHENKYKREKDKYDDRYSRQSRRKSVSRDKSVERYL